MAVESSASASPRRWRRVVLVAVVLAVAGGAYAGYWYVNREPTLPLVEGWALNGSGSKQPRVQNFDGLVPARGMHIVRNASKVEVFKLVGPEGGMPWDFNGQTLGRTETPGPAVVRELTELLANPATYTFPTGNKKCGGFQPREAVRFTADTGSVSFLICFKCSDIEVVVNNARGLPVHRGLTGMGPGRSALRAALLKVLTDDPYLTSLKEH